MKKVGIIMGMPIIEKSVDILKEFSIPFEVHVYSAHRTPEETIEFSKNAEKKILEAPILFYIIFKQV